jgi:hypothetical protein
MKKNFECRMTGKVVVEETEDALPDLFVEARVNRADHASESFLIGSSTTAEGGEFRIQCELPDFLCAGDCVPRINCELQICSPHHVEKCDSQVEGVECKNARRAVVACVRLAGLLSGSSHHLTVVISQQCVRELNLSPASERRARKRQFELDRHVRLDKEEKLRALTFWKRREESRKVLEARFRPEILERRPRPAQGIWLEPGKPLSDSMAAAREQGVLSLMGRSPSGAVLFTSEQFAQLGLDKGDKNKIQWGKLVELISERHPTNLSRGAISDQQVDFALAEIRRKIEGGKNE